MTNCVFEPPPSPSVTLWDHEVPKLVIEKRHRRIDDYEKRGAEVFLPADDLRREINGRGGTNRTVWRAPTGRIFEPMPEHPDVLPDAVLVLDLGAMEFQTLAELDAEVYEIAARRHREEVAAEEAERERRKREADDALARQPKRPVRTYTPLTLSAVVARVHALHGTLNLYENRVCCLLPTSVNDPAIARSLDLLRALLVASNCGQQTKRCDLEDCDEPAEVVGSGGAFLCVEHGS